MKCVCGKIIRKGESHICTDGIYYCHWHFSSQCTSVRDFLLCTKCNWYLFVKGYSEYAQPEDESEFKHCPKCGAKVELLSVLVKRNKGDVR